MTIFKEANDSFPILWVRPLLCHFITFDQSIWLVPNTMQGMISLTKYMITTMLLWPCLCFSSLVFIWLSLWSNTFWFAFSYYCFILRSISIWQNRCHLLINRRHVRLNDLHTCFHNGLSLSEIENTIINHLLRTLLQSTTPSNNTASVYISYLMFYEHHVLFPHTGYWFHHAKTVM